MSYELMAFNLLKKCCNVAFKKTMTVAKGFCIVHVVITHICFPVLLYGPSMVPTISATGEVGFVERISTKFKRVSSGDIVLLRSPEDPHKIITKRVTAMEGDFVTCNIYKDNNDDHGSLIVPKGHVWVQGDNIHDSRDSRRFGAVPYGLLQGRLLWSIPVKMIDIPTPKGEI